MDKYSKTYNTQSNGGGKKDYSPQSLNGTPVKDSEVHAGKYGAIGDGRKKR